jgi:tetratricopeptide (TPR) repeat protein
VVPAVCGLLALLVLVVFCSTCGYEFVNFDDDEYVYENDHVRAGLTIQGIAWALTAFHASNWHPLTWLSHMLDCQLYGMNPGGHHLTNVFLHAAAAIVLFLTMKRMTGAMWPSAWVAAVFAIHPLRVESVAWVAERKDVLSGLFFMLTLWCYARYVERPASWSRYACVVVVFLLGLLAKPMLVTLPCVLLLLDYWPLRRFAQPAPEADAPWFPARWAPLIIEKLPLFGMAAASCALTIGAQRNALASLDRVPFFSRAANAAVAAIAYIGKLLYPVDLAVLYPLPAGPRPIGTVITAVVMLAAISTTAFALRRKCPYLIVGWLWYLGTLVPVIGLMQVGSQAMADRYTYLTQIGLSIAIAWGSVSLAGRSASRQRALAAVACVLVVAMMGCAWRQTAHWRDSQALWTHTLRCTSRNWLAHNNLGFALAARGQIDDAIDQYRKALAIKPDHFKAHYNLANAFAGRGQADEAVAEYLRALEIEPRDVDAHNNLGLTLASLGQVDEAIDAYRRALELKPDSISGHTNLGIALTGRGQVDEAISHYRQALEIDPEHVGTRCNYGNALLVQGKRPEALEQYRKALDAATRRNDQERSDAIRAHIERLGPEY